MQRAQLRPTTTANGSTRTELLSTPERNSTHDPRNRKARLETQRKGHRHVGALTSLAFSWKQSVERLLSRRESEISRPVLPAKRSRIGSYFEFRRVCWAQEARALGRNEFFNGLLVWCLKSPLKKSTEALEDLLRGLCPADRLRVLVVSRDELFDGSFQRACCSVDASSDLAFGEE